MIRQTIKDKRMLGFIPELVELGEISKSVKRLRKRRKLTQRELALKSGIHKNDISSIENNNYSRISVKKLINIYISLGVEIKLMTFEQ